MKRPILTFCLLLFTLLLTAQAPFPSKDEIKQFAGSKTCVVLDEDSYSVYNTYIKRAMKEYWTITPYEFIQSADFGARRLNPEYSFILLTQTNFENDKSNAKYNFINLLQGKNIEKLGQMPEICAIPLSFAGEEGLEYGYKLGAILNFMQKHAMMIADDPSLTGRRYLRYYNKFTPEVHTRKILVRQEDLSKAISTPESIKSVYGYEIVIAPEADIMKAIADKAPNTLVLHVVGPGEESLSGTCYKMLIGTDDANMYYYNQHRIDKANPYGLLPADLKRMVK
jgi:hypothetical protein